MEMPACMNDPWKNWLTTGSDDAFRAVVRYHLPLVLATARRRTNGNVDLAQDISQLVFIDLARNAKALPKGVVLAGWLHRHTCFTAAKVLRTERRRATREKTAAEQTSEHQQTPADAVIDDILAGLPARDRHALLLRFAEGRALQEVADALHISREAAQKRIERALLRLRQALPPDFRPRMASTAGLTALLIPAHSKTAAAASTAGIEQMALVAAKTGKTTPLLTFFRNLSTLQGAAMGVAVSVVVWAVPLSLQLKKMQEQEGKSAAAASPENRPPSRKPVALVSAEDAGKQMASMFLTFGFSTSSSKLALDVLRQVTARDRLDAVRAMLATLPADSPHTQGVAEVLREFGRDGAWHPKNYPEDILIALDLLPRGPDPEFDAILENHPDVDATLRLYHELRRRNGDRFRKKGVPTFSRAVARALARRDILDALRFCKTEAAPGDVPHAVEGMVKAAEFPVQRERLWNVLTEDDWKQRNIVLAALVDTSPESEVNMVVENLPSGDFRNAAASLLARKQTIADGPQSMSIDAIADAWLARVPAEERAEQFHLLWETSGTVSRWESLFERLSKEFSGYDLDRLLGYEVRVAGSDSSPPERAIRAWERIVDPDIRFSAGCELVHRWARWAPSSPETDVRQEARDWMQAHFTGEQQEAYAVLHGKL